MNFVKLTQCATGADLWVNLPLVVSFGRANGGSIIEFIGSSLFVAETPEQIMGWIATGKLE